MPDWITAAIMFNNTTSYPLLLIQSMDETGILSSLIVTNETTHDAIERAKSYFLVFATVSSCLTFAVGPRLIDSEHAHDPEDDKNDQDETDDEETETGVLSEDPSERTRLLSTQTHRASVVPTSFFPSKPKGTFTAAHYDRRPSVISKRRWLRLSDGVRWWLLFFYDFLNAPLIGAVLGAIIGLVPVLHRSFFNDTEDGGIFSAWLTASLKSVGSVFVPLPVVVAGVSLYLSIQKARSGDSQASTTPWPTTVFILVVRFLLWPVLSIGVIYALAKHTDYLGQDPMLWFCLMLAPTGPSAMKLITLVQASDADEEDEHKIAKLLTVSTLTRNMEIC
jgi:predicted permease